jgi:hypothetical protein
MAAAGQSWTFKRKPAAAFLAVHLERRVEFFSIAELNRLRRAANREVVEAPAVHNRRWNVTVVIIDARSWLGAQKSRGALMRRALARRYRPSRRKADLAGADLEHLGTTDGTLAFHRGTAVLHRDLDCVFDLALGLALYAIRFCCQLWYLRCGQAIPPSSAIPPASPAVCPT